jgi:WD40 repeat protein
MGTYRAVKIVYRAAFEHARPFEREFNGIQKFEPISRSHDGFVDVLQIGRTDEYFYYVMELADDVVTGQQIDPATYEPKTLRSQVQAKKPWPFEQCVELGLSLTAALGHLHGHGLIHRDIKPSNIIFVNGIPKLADIGLVAEQSEAKSFVGTEGFIPPEGPGTPQADIYSLGKVLYEIATGKDRHEFPALPTMLGDSATDTPLLELNSIFLKACQSDLKLRYPTAKPMQDDLLLLRSGRSVKRAQAAERRLALLTKVSVVGALLTTLTLVGFYFAKRQAKFELSLRGRAQEAERITRRNLVRELVAAGNRRAEDGDLLGALPSYVEALAQEQDDLPAQERHRMRIGATLHQAPRLVQLWAHDAAVNSVAFSPDGKWVASGSDDRSARLWNIDNGQEVYPPLVHLGPVLDVSFSPDGGRLLTRSGDDSSGEARIWEAPSGRLLGTVKRRGRMPIAIFSPDGRELLISDDATGAQLCDGFTGQLKRPLPHPAPIVAAAFSPDGRRLVTSATDSRVRLWDTVTRQIIAEAIGSWQMDHLAFSPDGQFYAVTGGNSGIWIRDGRTGAEVRTFAEGDVPAVASLCFSPDGQRLLMAYWTQLVSIWDVRTGARMAGLNLEAKASGAHTHFGAEYSPDGRAVLTWGDDGTARVWSSRTGGRLYAPVHHDGAVATARFGPESRRVATGGKDGLVKLWDLDTPSAREPRESQLNGYQTVKWSPDGHRLALATWQGKVLVCDFLSGELETARSLSDDPNLSAGIRSIRWSRDGKRLLLVANSSVFRVWNGDTCIPISPRVAITPPVADLSPDGDLVASASTNGPVVFYRAESGEAIGSRSLAHSQPIEGLRFDHAGRHLLTYDVANCLRFWDVHESRLIGVVEKVESLNAAEFSPNDSLLATASSGGQARIWSLTNGLVLLTSLNHREGISAVAFSPDTQKILTASSDGTACLWETRSGRKLLTLPHGLPVWSASFSHDGRRMATGSGLGARLWDVLSGDSLSPWLSVDDNSSAAAPLFNPIDDRLLITGGSLAQIWRVPADDRPLDQLASHARLVAGATTGLSSAEITTAWARVREHLEREFDPSADETIQWHRRMAQEASAAGNPQGAQFHGTRWLRARPGDVDARRIIARGLIDQGHVIEAQEFAPDIVPVRPQEATGQQLDLTAFYNSALGFAELNASAQFHELIPGLHRFDGILFDVRGMVELAGVPALHRGRPLPLKKSGIPVKARVQRFHMLHTTGYETAEGTLIGRYTINYLDGGVEQLPIRYGEDVRNQWFGGIADAVFDAKAATVVWRGNHPYATRFNATLRLCKRTYENPRPDQDVVSIDFESTLSSCSPMLLAVTIE